MDKKKGAGPAELTPLVQPGPDKKAELLAELGAIEKILAGAMEKDDFCRIPILSVRRAPAITYQAAKAIAALLRKILE